MQVAEQIQHSSFNSKVGVQTENTKSKNKKEGLGKISEIFLSMIQGSIKLNQTNSIITSFGKIQKSAENQFSFSMQENINNENRSENDLSFSSKSNKNVQNEPLGPALKEFKSVNEDTGTRAMPIEDQKEVSKFRIEQKGVNRVGDQVTREVKGFEQRKENLEEAGSAIETDLLEDTSENKGLKDIILKTQDKKSKENPDLDIEESAFENRINQIKANRRRLNRIDNSNESSNSKVDTGKKGQITETFRNFQNIYFSDVPKKANQNFLNNDMANSQENTSVKMNYGVQNNAGNRLVGNARFQKLIENPFFKDQMNEQFQKLLNRTKILIKDQKNASLTTNLHPKELGQISLKLALLDGNLNGYFTVDNDNVQRLLLERMDKILEELREDGYKVSQFQVDVKSDDSSKETQTGSKQRTGFSSQGLNYPDHSKRSDIQMEGGLYA